MGWRYTNRIAVSGETNGEGGRPRRALADSKRSGSAAASVDLGYSALFERAGTPPSSSSFDSDEPVSLLRGPIVVGPYDMSALSSHLSVDVPDLGTRMAIQVDVPVPHLRRSYSSGVVGVGPGGSLLFLDAFRDMSPAISYCASFDLNDGGGGGAGGGSSSKKSATSPQSSYQGVPPIVLTLHKIDPSGGRGGSSTAHSAATISQTLSFDRPVANLMEERCESIRNTVSWAVRVSRTSPGARSSGGDPTFGGDGGSSSNLTAAAAWQVNRGLGFKMRFDARGGIDLGILMRRWDHPRVTASLS